MDWPANAPLTDSLLNGWQRGFPLTRRPFADIGHAQGVTQAEVIDTCARLLGNGAISRIGGVWSPGAGGAALLCAIAVPQDRLLTVAEQINAHPGVNHNYEREHALNLWFVLTGPDQARLEQTLTQIERDTALPVLRMKMVRPYRIDLGFDLHQPAQADIRLQRSAPPVQPEQRPLAALLEAGLPLAPEPFDLWAAALGCASDDVLRQLQAWLDAGTLRRFGLIVRHHEAGFTANAMTVFDLPDSEVDALGQRLAAQPGVTLCYQRQRAPGWRYNLYCMVHGRSRDQTLQLLHAAIDAAGLTEQPREVLFSRRRFKQTGARYFA
ncbi:MAG: Lrp/AsnC family transcriptional regulator [Burkholderiaceae bacterium]|jgi:DNA-binding Lrp family transcriptional regulator|nr:Lrp/AsnC family transcriptional regulator [Burkholderiaceae bacterium]